MNKNPIQFAITREDPNLELFLIAKYKSKQVLLVGSGGDTFFALKHAVPEVGITVFDFNPAQLAHIQNKVRAPKSELNQEPTGLCQNGNFESLFRSWRKFFNEFVLNEQETREAFSKSFDWSTVFSHSYWSVAFDLHFHDTFLRAMFGDAAVQHAPKGSYPRYFQRVFERGLSAPDFATNPFLQHIFFGTFLQLPTYLENKPSLSSVEFIQGTLFDVPNLSRFDLVQLSNIFDWSSLSEIRRSGELLADKLKSGSIVLIRQINNESPVLDALGPQFEFMAHDSNELLKLDRSLFYSKILVARKR